MGISAQHMNAFCLKTLLQMENLQISLLFLLDLIAACWLTLLARSMPMAGMLCAHQPLSHHCPSPSLPTPEAEQKQCINNEEHIFYISIAKQDMFLLLSETKENTLKHCLSS